MAKSNKAKTTIEKIDQLKAQRLAEISDIEGNIMRVRKALEDAEEGIKKAIESTNLQDFESSNTAKNKAETELKMYESRLEQIKNREYIHEDESDEVITSLLEYEKDITADYLQKSKVIIEQLAELTNTYRTAVDDTETALLRWTNEIHANHRTFGRTYYTRDGKTTDRSEKPVPVRVVQYSGCFESNIAKNFIELYEQGNRNEV